MTTKKASGYNQHPMEHNFGNVSAAHFRHVFTEADKDGDILRLGRLGFGMKYFYVQVASASGLGPGVTIDLGYHGVESCADIPDFFFKGKSVASQMDIIVPSFRMLFDKHLPHCSCDPEEVDKCAPKWGEIHEPILTIHGAPAADACLDIILFYEHNH